MIEDKEKNVKETKEKKKRQQIHEFDLSQDIRYRGPLSYRSFKILGWICLAISQLVLLFNLVSKAAPADLLPSQATLGILALIGSLAIPDNQTTDDVPGFCHFGFVC